MHFTRHSTIRSQRGALCAALLIMLAGCSEAAKDAPATVNVSGTVSLDGEALSNASVTFLPETIGQGLSAASGRTDNKGRYDLEFNTSQSGIKAGSYRVVISTIQTNEDGDDVGQEIVPEAFNRKTTLSAAVNDSQRTFDFELTSDAGPISQPLPNDAPPRPPAKRKRSSPS